MKRIRIGNDIWVRFAVMRDTQLEVLPPAEQITVGVENISRWSETLQYHNLTAEDGVISFLIKGLEPLDDENKYLGKYRITISYQLPAIGEGTDASLHTVDAVAFELVQFSHLQGYTSHNCPELAVDTVELTGNIATGQNGITPHVGDNGNWWIGDEDTGVLANGKDGPSAYQLALENGFVGSEQEWLDSLEGNEGEQGLPGDDGKSAYQSAYEGGLPEEIDEQVFNKTLAMNSNGVNELLDAINGAGEARPFGAKLNMISATKTKIANQIIAKGVPVSDADTFDSYANKIAEIDTGSGVNKALEFIQNRTVILNVDSAYDSVISKIVNGDDFCSGMVVEKFTADVSSMRTAHGFGMNSNLEEIPLNWESLEEAANMVLSSKIKTFKINAPLLALANQFAASSGELVTAEIISDRLANINYGFASCHKLKSLTLPVGKLFSMDSVVDSCRSLVDLIFTGGTLKCNLALSTSYNTVDDPQLSPSTFRGIIDSLEDFSGESPHPFPRSITINETHEAMLTEEDKEEIVNLGWSLIINPLNGPY